MSAPLNFVATPLTLNSGTVTMNVNPQGVTLAGNIVGSNAQFSNLLVTQVLNVPGLATSNIVANSVNAQSLTANTAVLGNILTVGANVTFSAQTIFGNQSLAAPVVFSGVGGAGSGVSLDLSSYPPAYGTTAAGNVPGIRFLINDLGNFQDSLNVQQSALGGNALASRIFMGPTGLIGLGTTSPAYLLDVNGNLRVTGNAFMNSNLNVTNALNVAGNTTLANLAITGVFNLTGSEIATGNLSANNVSLSNALTVNGFSYLLGNVGVGTLTPAYPLDISGPFRVTGPAFLNNALTVSGGATVGGALSAASIATSGNVAAGDAVLSGNLCLPYGGRLCTTTSTWAPYLRSVYNVPTLSDTVVFSVPGGQANIYSNVLTLAGNSSMMGVGVGTTNPQFSLDVSGSVRATGLANLQGPVTVGNATLASLSFPAVPNGIGTATAVAGGPGDRIVLYPGTSSFYPYSIGLNPNQLSLNTPAGSSTSFYTNGAYVAAIGAGGLTTGNTGISISTNASDPGDLISKQYATNDRYGVGQFAGGKTRLITSSAYAPATVGMALCGANAQGTSNIVDLISANAQAISMYQPLLAPKIVANNVSSAIYTAQNSAITTYYNPGITPSAQVIFPLPLLTANVNAGDITTCWCKFALLGNTSNTYSTFNIRLSLSTGNVTTYDTSANNYSVSMISLSGNTSISPIVQAANTYPTIAVSCRGNLTTHAIRVDYQTQFPDYGNGTTSGSVLDVNVNGFADMTASNGGFPAYKNTGTIMHNPGGDTPATFLRLTIENTTNGLSAYSRAGFQTLSFQ